MDFNSPFLLILIGLLYILVMGALSVLRREGLSLRFAVESLLVIAVVVGLAFATGFVLHPLLFLILLYLVTMRARLLVDLGNSLASRRRFSTAERIYDLALSLGADPIIRANIAINRGVARLQKGAPGEAIAIFQQVLESRANISLGIKNEAACQYNLGVAYQREGREKESAQAFRAVLDVWPVSEYARRATAALARQSQKVEEQEHT